MEHKGQSVVLLVGLKLMKGERGRVCESDMGEVVLGVCGDVGYVERGNWSVGSERKGWALVTAASVGS